MRVWVYRKKSDSEYVMVTQKGNSIKIFEKNKNRNIVDIKMDTWSTIDGLKDSGELVYVDTFRTFGSIPSILFFNMDWR